MCIKSLVTALVILAFAPSIASAADEGIKTKPATSEETLDRTNFRPGGGWDGNDLRTAPPESSDNSQSKAH